MNKIVLLISLLVLFGLNAEAQLLKEIKSKAKEVVKKGESNNLSEKEVAEGLKAALNQGVEKGVDQLSAAGGYLNNPEVKIPLPSEAQVVESKLRQLGQGKLVDEAVESVNRAAEDAASEAKDLFVAAIQKMTINDAMNILKGNNDAATQYLSNSTRADLLIKFKPIIKVSLEKVNATKHWKTMFSTYNKVPFVKKVNPDLEDYVTNKAIDGLFLQIAKEELKIREDPAARLTDILKKVFG